MDRVRTRKRARDEDRSVCSTAVKHLPSHILMEIMSRLPIKTVMVIKCVSKSLLKLVSGSYFAKLHSTRAPTELLLRNHRQEGLSLSTTLYIADPVLQDHSSINVGMKFNLLFDLPRFSVSPQNKLNFRDNTSPFIFVNTCNGLVCCIGTDTNSFAVICNPITGEYVTIPCPGKDKTLETFYGLGFSPKDNRFKLLRLLYRKAVGMKHLVGGERTRICDVYTFGESGSWKSVANCPEVYLPAQVTYFEGLLHCSGDNFKFAFDFDTCQFGDLKSRHFWPMEMDSAADSCLGVFEDHLYITGSVGDCAELWMMKEYGVLSSWVKVLSVPIDALCFSNSYEPIRYFPNGEIMMLKNGHDIVFYNQDTGSLKSIGSCSLACEAVFIKPSLISLKVMLRDNVEPRNSRWRGFSSGEIGTTTREWTIHHWQRHQSNHDDEPSPASLRDTSLVIDLIDRNGEISHLLYRDSCHDIDGRFMKDLTGLGRDLNWVAIVDDNPNSNMLLPENAIPVRPFIDDAGDRELGKLLWFFQNSVGFDDLKQAVKLYRLDIVH